MSGTTDYEITVKIRVTVNDPPVIYDDPKQIAQNYADMAINYRSIGASKAEVIEIVKVK